jgi:hypothetical protein
VAWWLGILTVAFASAMLVNSMPSFDVSRTVLCLDAENPDCKPQLRVLAAISSVGAEWRVTFTLPSTAIFTGPSNTTWGANGTDSASFSFARLNTHMKFPLDFFGTFTTMSVVEERFCVSGIYCCTGQDGIERSFRLVEEVGAKKYHVFRTSSPGFEWDLNINVTIGNTSSIVSLANSALRGSWPENMLEPVLSGRAIPFETVTSSSGSQLSGRMIAVDPTWSRVPFWVPEARMLSPDRLSLSMTQSKLNNLLTGLGTCDIQQANALVKEPGTTDVFGVYTSSSVTLNWADSLVSLSKSRLAPTAPPHRLVVNLNGRLTTLVELLLKSENYTLTPITAEPVGTGGYGYVAAETGIFHAFIDVTNAGRTPGYVQVQADRCCYAPSNASLPVMSCSYLFQSASDTPATKGQFMVSAETLRFRFETKINLSGQSGYCTFVLTGGSGYTRTFDIGFPMEISVPTPSTPTAPCEDPYIPLPDPPFCQSPCTVDQIYNTSTSVCDPVDCVRKYVGNRPYYDVETGLCKPYAPPPIDVPTEEPTVFIPAVTVPSGGTPAFPMTPEGTYTIDCGEHGTYNPQSLNCDCEAGWITDTQQPVSEFEFCGVQSTFQPGTIHDAQTPTKGTVNYFKLIVAVSITFVCVLVIGLIAGYIISRRMAEGESSEDDPSDSESL